MVIRGLDSSIFKKDINTTLPIYGFLFLVQGRYERRQIERLLRYFKFKTLRSPFFNRGADNCLFFGTDDYNQLRLMLEYLYYLRDPSSLVELD